MNKYSIRYTDEELLQDLRRCEEEHGKVTQKIINNTENDYANSTTYRTHFGTLTEAKKEAGVEVSQDHLTDEEYERINKSLKNDEELQEMLEGLLMGDAFVQRDKGKNAKFSVEMINKDFLEWVAGEMGDACSLMKRKNTAEELYEKNNRRYDNVSKENYNDIYTLRSRSVEFFNRYYDWYESGEKRYPEDTELTPLMLNMWYCCDGSLVEHGKNPNPVIYCSNEYDRKEFIEGLFDPLDPTPSVHGGGGGVIQFKRGETSDFFNYIGESPPGYEYKWPEEER